MVSIGIDIGSVCANAVVYDERIIGRLIMPTGWNPRQTAEELYERLVSENEIKKGEIAFNYIMLGKGAFKKSHPIANATGWRSAFRSTRIIAELKIAN